MASKRMIAGDIFEDEFVGFLNFFGRLVWIGMIVACADDQGRMLDSSPLIRSRTFPFDKNITDDKVDETLAKAAKEGKIVRYEAAGKQLLQIVHWWDYQQPAWASPSKYQAPEGWVDRVRCHVAGNKIYRLNWEMIGGFTEGYEAGTDSKLRSILRSGIEEGESDDESEFEESTTPSSPIIVNRKSKIPKNPKEADQHPDITIYRRVSGIFPGKQNYEDVIDTIQFIRMQQNFPSDEALETYLTTFWQAWKGSKRRDGEPFDEFNLAWLTEWAVGGKIPSRNKKPKLVLPGANGNGHKPNSLAEELARREAENGNQ